MTTPPENETEFTLGEVEDSPKGKKPGKPSTDSAKPSAGKAKSAKGSPAKKSPAAAKAPSKTKTARPASSGKTAAGKQSKAAKPAKAKKTPATKAAKKNASPKTPKEPRKRKESVNLVRIDQNGARFTPGWQVKIRTEKLTVSKWFGDKKTGGEAKGKAAALKWRDEQLASAK